MTYEEIVNKVEGKPISATLTIKLGGGTVKLTETFVKSLSPAVVQKAFDTDRELTFRGKPDEAEDNGQGQNSRWKAKQFAIVIADHFGLAKSETNGEGKGRKSRKGRKSKESTEASGEMAGVPSQNGQTVNA